MSKSIVFLFSGQGSQYYHMAKELFTKYPLFRLWMLKLDTIVRDITGESVLDQIYDDQKTHRDSFDRVVYTHPAIFMVEYSLYHVLIDRGIMPDYVFGTSMGEFAAATVAETVNVEQCLKLLLYQAESFEEHCSPGAMLAILTNVTLYYETPFIHNNAELASLNYGSHFVISGGRDNLHQIEAYLKQKNILYQSLPVTYGFHSSCIEPAASTCKEILRQESYQLPRIPIVSGLRGILLKNISHDYFWDVVRLPTRFTEALEYLEGLGDNIYIDLGPSGTLANFVKRNIGPGSRSESHAMITPFHQELKNLDKIRSVIAKQTYSI